MTEPLLVELSTDEIKAGMIPSTEAFMGQSAAYTAISAEARTLVDAGRAEALYVPAVQYVVDAALNIVTQPKIEPKLPKSVTGRSQVAIHFAQLVVSVGLESGTFSHFYAHNPALWDAPMGEGEMVHLTHPQDKTGYLASIGAAPFYDAGVVSGGALNFLREQGVADPPAEVIKRSTGLLALAGVYKSLSKVAFEYLGLPYAATTHYRLVRDAPETTLAFSEETATMLSRFRIGNRGCPSGGIDAPEQPGTSMLQYAWHRLVDYLVPEDATAEVA